MVVAAVLLGTATTVLAHRADPAAAVSASSSAAGTRAQDLLGEVPDAPGARRAVWASDGEAVGAWLSLVWSRPTRVDTVRLRAAEPERAPRSLLVGFDDGSSLLVTTGPDGDAEVTFPERTTSSVRLTVAEAAPGAGSVALAGLSVEDGDGDVRALGDGDAAAVQASSGAPAGTALQDGDAAAADAGAEWRADASDGSPWVELGWRRPVEVSSVQVLGPSVDAVDPVHPATAALSGVLRFDDGSEVVVSGIAGGDAQPTTIAFAPRVARSVRLELARSVATAQVALREFRAHGTGTTPPRWAATGETHTAEPPAAGCGDDVAAPAAPAPPDRPVLLCPAPGSVAAGPTTIVVAAAPGTVLRAEAPMLDGARTVPVVREVGGTTAGADGRAVLSVDTAAMPRGPVTVRVRAGGAGDAPGEEGAGGAGAAAEREVPVQLLNRAGRALASPGFAPGGATLQWEETFSDPLSVSASGRGAVYAAAKPVSTGTQSFGDAAFADPALGAGTVTTVDGYLRLRAEPTAGRSAAAPYDQQYLGGMVSSLRVGASGFAAQYGYFEARMTGAPGPGSWPAFWTMNTRSATRDDAVGGEADVVELYGHDPVGSCHGLHHYDTAFEGGQRGEGRCLTEGDFSDWTTTWHTYGMRVLPDGAVFYVDGVEVADLRGLGRHEEPFYFMLDLALGGGWPVDLSATGGTTDLYVDWVRVYT
ncbi:glycoside hydrolase family 16 protein [Kineococcus gypseus]|uniref:glycoside hydrolase family 16 protein n=1 Tax=Kineococcus gypseus TaxID=1637102 RepID=UPI003D7C543A